MDLAEVVAKFRKLCPAEILSVEHEKGRVMKNEDGKNFVEIMKPESYFEIQRRSITQNQASPDLRKIRRSVKSPNLRFAIKLLKPKSKHVFHCILLKYMVARS